MSNYSTTSSNVIPFDFRGHSVRVVVIGEEPWFVAVDACRFLGQSNTTKALHALDEDERSNFKLGRQGLVNIINESGLYTLILRCNDAIKKGSDAHAFRKWVTSEVLPSIRKHGQYVDSNNKMSGLMNSLIGVTELAALKGVMSDKARNVAPQKRLSFLHAMHHRLHTRFNVPRTELILHKDFADACNFIAAYALEGEYLPKEDAPTGFMTKEDLYRVYVLTVHFNALHEIFRKYKMYEGLKALGSRAGIEMIDHFKDGHYQAYMLREQHGQAMDDFQREHGLNHYRQEVTA